jgi:PAS domain S-box-containing protein
MLDFLSKVLDTSDFPARWNCGHWTAAHGWLHIVSDLGVWAAYVTIPCVLAYFVLRRRDIPFRGIFLLFGAFILACGTTHLMEALIFWWPAYRLAGLIKLFTAIVSWGTVLALVPVTPRALAMRGPEELEREIAARKQAETALQQANGDLRQQVEALRASEERFRLLVDGTKDYAIFMLDPFGRVASWNPGAERINGYRAGEIIGQHFSRFYPTEVVQTGLPDRWLRVATAEGRYEDEGWRLRKDGSKLWANVVITALRDEAGNLRGFSKITRDLTARKQAEENARRLVEEETARQAAEAHAAALWEERERLRVTLHSIGDGVIATDATGRITLINPVAEALTAWNAAEAAGQPLQAVFPIINELTREEAENPVARALREGGVVGLANHTILLARDGTERAIDDSAAPIRSEQGQVLGVILVFRDATERRAAEAAAHKHEQVLKLVHQIGKIGHWEWDSLTDENKWSPEIEALYGLPPGGFKGGYQGWAKLVHPDDLPRAEADVRRALETGEYFTDFRVIWPDGSVHWLETRAAVLKDGHDKPVRIVGVNMDITERKRLEQELQRRLTELAAADRRKDEFLATLAHELRNPLAPLRNALEILHRTDGDAALAEQARRMMGRQLDQLVRLVDDLLDVSRISRGKVRLRKERVELQAVLRSALEAVQPLIQAQGHELTITLPHEDIPLDADATRLAQVIANLLNNAAKYTEKGGHIWLTAERQGNEAVVSVRDRGIGIAAEHLPHLFEMFSQLTPALERSQGGLGIGLALVRGLVEMHGGRVEARSDGIGQGSEFIVRLPLAEISARPELQAGEDRPVAGSEKRRILVVDDNRDAADSLTQMLRMIGHEAHTAYDGLEAVQAASAVRPDVVLLDIGLPKLNGYEAAAQIRQQPWGKGLTLIALTGWGQEEDKHRAFGAGFDHHLTKPVEAAALETLLALIQPVATRSEPEA